MRKIKRNMQKLELLKLLKADELKAEIETGVKAELAFAVASGKMKIAKGGKAAALTDTERMGLAIRGGCTFRIVHGVDTVKVEINEPYALKIVRVSKGWDIRVKVKKGGVGIWGALQKLKNGAFLKGKKQVKG